MKKLSLASTGLLCLSFLLLSACGDNDKTAAAEAPAPSVGVLVMEPESTALSKNLVGRLSAFRRADVRARVPGVLLERTYKEGEQVKKGQLLFRIDPAPLTAAADAAKAQLAQAKASYTNAHVKAERARKLAPKGFISAVDKDDAEAVERTTAAALKAAEANLTAANIKLSYTKVVSPIAGRAGQQQVTEGALVGQAGATLLTRVEQLDPLYVNFTMPSEQLSLLRQAQADGKLSLNDADKTEVRVTLAGGASYPQVGVLDFSSPSVDPDTGAVQLRAQLPNPDQVLMPGGYVNLKVDLGQRHKVYLLPQNALLRDIGGAYVLLVNNDNKVEHRKVTTAGMTSGRWVVTNGLANGDRVIVSGIQRAKPGAEVDPDIKPNAAESAAATVEPPSPDATHRVAQ